MSRIRTIKPQFFTDVDMAELTPAERITFIGLWTYVDDEGRGLDEPALIKAALWPLDSKVTVKKVGDQLTRLATKGRLQRYKAEGKRCLFVCNFLKHQRISKPTKSDLPPPPVAESSRSPRGDTEDELAREGKGMEEERKGKDSRTPPVVSGKFEVWDALVELLGYEPQASSERSLWGKRVKELKEAGATPQEISRRGQVWKRTYPNTTLTINVLPKWWGALGATPMNGHAPAAWAAIAAAVKSA